MQIFRIKKSLQSRKKVRQSVGHVSDYWRGRIDEVKLAPDNAYIKRVPKAGMVEDYYLTMHNGIKICGNGYYGSGMLNLLIENQGVHEPQEERAFNDILKYIASDCTMLELGSYWSFYSLTLLNHHPSAHCYLVEPSLRNLIAGKINFELNGRDGHFSQLSIGDTVTESQTTVDTFCDKHDIKLLDILHADIQGFELKMLHGASHMLRSGRIHYIFISTHSQELHYACCEELEKNGYTILASADLDETFSWDGLIVAKLASIKHPPSLTISHKGRS